MLIELIGGARDGKTMTVEDGYLPPFLLFVKNQPLPTFADLPQNGLRNSADRGKAVAYDEYQYSQPLTQKAGRTIYIHSDRLKKG